MVSGVAVVLICEDSSVSGRVRSEFDGRRGGQRRGVGGGDFNLGYRLCGPLFVGERSSVFGVANRSHQPFERASDLPDDLI